jgi:hypothetical protein
MNKASVSLLTIALVGLAFFLLALALNIPHIGTPKRGRSELPRQSSVAPAGQASGVGSVARSAPPTTSGANAAIHDRPTHVETQFARPAKVRAADGQASFAFKDLGQLVLGATSEGKTGIKKDQEGVQVWISKNNGYYYCADSRYYRTLSPGAFMPQGKALQSGYQPKLGQLCD